MKLLRLRRGWPLLLCLLAGCQTITKHGLSRCWLEWRSFRDPAVFFERRAPSELPHLGITPSPRQQRKLAKKQHLPPHLQWEGRRFIDSRYFPQTSHGAPFPSTPMEESPVPLTAPSHGQYPPPGKNLPPGAKPDFPPRTPWPLPTPFAPLGRPEAEVKASPNGGNLRPSEIPVRDQDGRPAEPPPGTSSRTPAAERPLPEELPNVATGDRPSQT